MKKHNDFIRFLLIAIIAYILLVPTVAIINLITLHKEANGKSIRTEN